MIVKMMKAYVVSRSARREDLLEALSDLGVVHLVPVDPQAVLVSEDTKARLDRLDRAVQILSAVEPSGQAPEMKADQVVDETLRIHRQSVERRNRLAALHRQLAQLAMWGDVRLADFKQLADAGLDVSFYSAPAGEVEAFETEVVEVLGDLPGKRVLIATVARCANGGMTVPPEAEPFDLPRKDRPAIRQEAAEIDALLQADTEELTRLARILDDVRALREEAGFEASVAAARNSAIDDAELFGVQGYVPAEQAETLGASLAEANIDSAVEISELTDEDNPPTLIEYPRWAMPIKGLFDILGTLPGYREIDISGFFMIALPIFAAMLIGDAGYGFLFAAIGLGMYRKFVAKAGKPATHLFIVVGLVTLIWGILSGNYFGVTPNDLNAAGGTWQTVGGHARSVALFMGSDDAAQGAEGTGSSTLEIAMKISFLLGSLHLIVARIRAFLAYLPSTKAIAELGWCLVLWCMLNVIWWLFKFEQIVPINLCVIAGVVGFLVAIVFTHPAKNPAKRVGIGLAASLLPLIGTFGDTMSYIRLMAAGLASYYIASAFNGLAASLASSATWFAAVPVLLFGHGLNIALAMIAIFAHGVRLNMLEFSSNAGVQWAGHEYKPFSKSHTLPR